MESIRYIIAIVVLLPAISTAQVEQTEESRQGILGSYQLIERWTLNHKVRVNHHNYFNDEFSFSPSKKDFEAARNALSKLEDPEMYKNCEAVFFIPQKGSDTLILVGAQMSGAQDRQGIGIADMTIVVSDKTLAQLKLMPHNTTVFGVDNDGHIGWTYLQFFELSEFDRQIIVAAGFYCYRYRPTKQLISKYGNASYYEDSIRLEKFY